MASARDEAQWDHTASIIAAVVTAASGEPCDPRAVHPHYRLVAGPGVAIGDTEIDAANLPDGAVFGLLKSAFTDNQGV